MLELKRPNPTEFLGAAGPGPAFHEPAFIKIKGNAPVRVEVVDFFEQPARFNSNRKLLPNFPLEAGAQTFRGEPLAARKFPESSQVVAFSSESD